MMGAFNYIGNTYASAHVGLNQAVLREEWGFKGMLETDYFSGLNYGYQTADQAIRGYTDIMLASTETTNHVTDHSATSVIAMRRAAHNILYTAVNSWRYADGEPADPMPAWQIAMIMLTWCWVWHWLDLRRLPSGGLRAVAVLSLGPILALPLA